MAHYWWGFGSSSSKSGGCESERRERNYYHQGGGSSGYSAPYHGKKTYDKDREQFHREPFHKDYKDKSYKDNEDSYYKGARGTQKGSQKGSHKGCRKGFLKGSRAHDERPSSKGIKRSYNWALVKEGRLQDSSTSAASDLQSMDVNSVAPWDVNVSLVEQTKRDVAQKVKEELGGIGVMLNYKIEEDSEGTLPPDSILKFLIARRSPRKT